LETPGKLVRFPIGMINVYILKSIQTDRKGHLAPYSIRIGGLFLGDRAAGAWSWTSLSPIAEVRIEWSSICSLSVYL